jgi:tetratricopeptide (TPR) repeat protein
MSALTVFVSHSHEDDTFCRQLVAALRGAGADVWYDEHYLGSDQLLDIIERELRARTVFILVLSEAALHSQEVRNETEWAFARQQFETGRILLPVLASAVEENDIWLWLQDFKRIEASGVLPFPADEAVRRTLLALALTPAGETRVAQVPQPSESAEELVTRGKALQAQGDHGEAVPFFECAMQRDPQSWVAWHSLGYSLIMLTRYADALPATERAITINPSSASSWTNKGTALYNLRGFAEALAAYEQALALNPKDATAWRGKGSALYNLKRLAEALAGYDQALALDPTYAITWRGKGSALNELNRYQEALAAFEQALILEPENDFGWHGKGNALCGLNRYQEALAAFEREIAIVPKDAYAWSGKADALDRLGRTQEAEQARAQIKALGG